MQRAAPPARSRSYTSSTCHDWSWNSSVRGTSRGHAASTRSKGHAVAPERGRDAEEGRSEPLAEPAVRSQEARR